MAVYEKGVLRPLTPLALPERSRVRVWIESVVKGRQDAAEMEAEAESGPELLPGLIGAYRSTRPLIDDIPVSEDPDLYLIAEALGERAEGRHAWEIAPAKYKRGKDRRPVRRMHVETEE